MLKKNFYSNYADAHKQADLIFHMEISDSVRNTFQWSIPIKNFASLIKSNHIGFQVYACPYSSDLFTYQSLKNLVMNTWLVLCISYSRVNLQIWNS